MMTDDVVLGKWWIETTAGSFLEPGQHRTVDLTPSAQSEVKNGSGNR